MNATLGAKIMSDIMRAISFEQLINTIFSEYRQKQTIFGLHEDQFFKPSKKNSIQVFGQDCATPLGPAAGPHTQLAQNIIASYLVGGRFIELKTVQILDQLEIDKPCICAKDEAYNVEWSSEFTLKESCDEYIKAYVILHLLEALLFERQADNPSFIFNMSVGYDFAGIKSSKMQTFIDSLLDASKTDTFKDCLESLTLFINDDSLLSDTKWENLQKSLKTLPKNISPKICNSVTLSTMHGCPPDEIEAICSYMLSEKKLNTFVKLNPTLLGYEKVRSTLDQLGYSYITLKKESFDNDLKYDDAIKMLNNLISLAEKEQLGFGVKLTNTLGVVNDQGNLPGDEMYMSGRSLTPLTLQVASILSSQYEGKLPISYSGGSSAATILELFESGIRPITVATDLLKPGGYLRLKEMANILESKAKSWSKTEIDLNLLKEVADNSLKLEEFKKEFRGFDEVKINGSLPITDCYVAPCVQACPIHQNIPDYIYLVGEGEYATALELIYETNALPNLTGYICDHQCQYVCTRLDYEGSVQIREMKKIAAEQGFADYIKTWEKSESADVKAAVIGSGPAGLAAAYFLSRSAFDVTVFEKERDAGGIMRNVIPEFRFPERVLQADIDFIEKHGVKFEFGVDNNLVTIQKLRDLGFKYIFYAIGSDVDNILPIEGAKEKVLPSLKFLTTYRENKNSINLGEDVVIVGGGNTAMDSARAAIRVVNVKNVTVAYRRSEKEMPADREEYLNAKNDGVKFLFLTKCEKLESDGTLICRKMELGDLDESNRRRPIESSETFLLHADTIITAIGERVDDKQLNFFGLPLTKEGWAKADEETLESEIENVYVIGDAQSGPSTIVRCIASARTAVEAALDKELSTYETNLTHDFEDIFDEDDLALEEQFFASIRAKKGRYIKPANFNLPFKEFAQIEAKRCLECNYVCDKCVEVCPNRANVAIDMRHRDDLFANPYQIVHIDALCNECGNCATFCPWEGSPYKDKLTLFHRLDDFENSKNNGFFVEHLNVTVRLNGNITNHTIDKDGSLKTVLQSEISSVIEQIIVEYRYLLEMIH